MRIIVTGDPIYKWIKAVPRELLVWGLDKSWFDDKGIFRTKEIARFRVKRAK